MKCSAWLARSCVVVCGGILFSAQAGGDGSAAKAERKAVSAGAWTPAALGKQNGSGIRLAYSLPADLQPGRSARVQLRFSGVSADDARVEWTAPEGGVFIAPVPGVGLSMPLPRDQVTTLALDVTPAADGMVYLAVFTSQGGRSSAHSVPLKVGSGAVVLKRVGRAETMPGGEKVISLPSAPK